MIKCIRGSECRAWYISQHAVEAERPRGPKKLGPKAYGDHTGSLFSIIGQISGLRKLPAAVNLQALLFQASLSM